MNTPICDNFYQHQDGGLYRVTGFARSTVDLTDLVIYEHIYPFEKRQWARPANEWTEKRFKLVPSKDVRDILSIGQTELQERITAAKQARQSVVDMQNM